MADPSQIHQIVMNIITNAFHAMEDKGGKISVQLREAVLDDSGPTISNMESGKYAALSISDTGHGMSEELIGKIFDPVFYNEGTRERNRSWPCDCLRNH